MDALRRGQARGTVRAEVDPGLAVFLLLCANWFLFQTGALDAPQPGPRRHHLDRDLCRRARAAACTSGSRRRPGPATRNRHEPLDPSPLPAPCPLVLALAAGCGDRDAAESKRHGPQDAGHDRRRPFAQRVDAVETTVGRIEATASPALAAETSGRVVRLLVDGGSVVRQGQVLAELDGEPQRLAVASARASVERLEALLANQQRTVKRYQELRSKAVSESMLEEAIAQESARQAELNDARARLAEAEYRLDRTRIKSPVDAIVERRLISVGDFVSPGTPIVTIVGRDGIRAVLPFPERLSGQLRPGLAVTLEQPARPGETVTGTVTEVRPMVGTNNRAVEALVDLPGASDWPAGGSVTAQHRARLARRRGRARRERGAPPGRRRRVRAQRREGGRAQGHGGPARRRARRDADRRRAGRDRDPRRRRASSPTARSSPCASRASRTAAP